MAFFKALGYHFNPQFTDDTAACMVISDTIYAMLLTKAKFASFTNKPVSDATTSTEVLIALSLDSRDAVRTTVAAAVAAGGTAPMPEQDHGFMLQHGFTDLDGHMWEVLYMDPAFVQPRQ